MVPAQPSEAAPYFIGSTVLIKNDAVAESSVVDGQQRLTTLTLLPLAIRATVGDDELQKASPHVLPGGHPGELKTLLKISLNAADRGSFACLYALEAGIAPIACHIYLCENIAGSEAQIECTHGAHRSRLHDVDER